MKGVVAAELAVFILLVGCGSSPGIEPVPVASQSSGTPSAPSAPPSEPPTSAPTPPKSAPTPPSQPAPSAPQPPASPPQPQPSPASGAASHRAIWIGDSLAARGWGPGGTVVMAPGGGFVVTGGPTDPLATITTTDPHGLIPGNYVQIFNVGDPSYSDPLNGAVVPVLAVLTPRQFTVAATYAGRGMPIGDYSGGHRGQPWLVSSMVQTTDASWLQWLNQFMQGYFTVVASYAQGSTVSGAGVALLPKIAAGPKADYAVIQYCTNDINAGIPDVPGCLANIRTIIAAVEALGMVPILCTPPAIGDTGAHPDPATAYKASALRAIEQGEQQIALADSHVILLDTYAQTANPSDSLGRYLPDYAPVDGLHPSSFGEVRIAEGLANQLKQSLPLTDLLPVSPSDDPTVDRNATNVVQNGMMSGGDGAVISTSANTIKGTAPTGWSISGSGGTSTTPLILETSGQNTHTSMAGYTLDVIVTAASAGQQFAIGSNGAAVSSFGSRIKPGGWYQCGFELLATTALTNLNVFGQVLLNFGAGNTPSIYFMSAGNRYDNGMPLNSGETLEFLSAPFYVPEQPASGAYLFIIGSFSGAVSHQSVSIGRAACQSVMSPYA